MAEGFLHHFQWNALREKQAGRPMAQVMEPYPLQLRGLQRVLELPSDDWADKWHPNGGEDEVERVCPWSASSRRLLNLLNLPCRDRCDREVHVVFDSGVMGKQEVHRALVRFVDFVAYTFAVDSDPALGLAVLRRTL